MATSSATTNVLPIIAHALGKSAVAIASNGAACTVDEQQASQKCVYSSASRTNFGALMVDRLTKAARAALLLSLLAAATLARAAIIPGPATIDLYTFGVLNDLSTIQLDHKTQADAAGKDYVEISSKVGDYAPGVNATASGGSFLIGTPFAASATAPRNFPSVTSPYIGGVTQVKVFRSFRKDSEQSAARFIFTDMQFELAWESEFGAKCPPNDDRCQQAYIQHEVKVWNATGDTPVNSSINGLLFHSVGNSTTSPGYAAQLIGDTKGISLTGTITRTGVDVSLPPFVPFVIEVDLSGIGQDELFTLEYELEVVAMDFGSHIGPGRRVFASAWDPLALENGNGTQLQFSGLTPWEELTRTAVPLPPTLALLTLGLACAVASRRLPGFRRE